MLIKFDDYPIHQTAEPPAWVEANFLSGLKRLPISYKPIV